MIKAISEKPASIEIDLTGPCGNAHFLLGFARTHARKRGMTEVEVAALLAEMMSGDYELLIQVFDRTFGDEVVLYR